MSEQPGESNDCEPTVNYRKLLIATRFEWGFHAIKPKRIKLAQLKHRTRPFGIAASYTGSSKAQPLLAAFAL